jgi:PAS domain S-box-containing protein
MDTDGIALIGVDRKGLVREWNQGARRIFKYSAREITGEPVTKLAAPEKQGKHQGLLKEAIRKRRIRPVDSVFRLLGQRRDRSPVLVEFQIKPLREHKRVYGFSIVAKDISEVDRRENELRKANEELTWSREEVRSSYEQLKASQENQVRSEKLAFAARMAASVAHEIRNPLGIVTLAIERLREKLKGEEDKLTLADTIYQSTERVNRLVTDFVNCTRPQKLRMRKRDIHGALRKLIALTKSKFKENRIKVILRFRESAPFVFIDPSRIEQAFLNIVLNAIDAMPRGGRVTIATEYDEEFVTVIFKDSGVGIAKENLFRVFDPFFTTKPVGTGLGLAVTYSIIASHNGVITVESRKGKGATFTIRFPREKQELRYANELELLMGGRL